MKTTTLLLLLILSGQVFAQSINQPQGSEYWNATSKDFMVKKARHEAVQGLNKGVWAVGAYTNYGAGSFVDMHLSFNTFGGYFIDNTLLIGLTAELSNEWITRTDWRSRFWGVGPMIRWYITHTKIAPYLEANYQLGINSTKSNVSIPIMSGSGTTVLMSLQESRIGRAIPAFIPGLSVQLLPSIRAELAYKFQKNMALRTWEGYPQFGLTKFF